MYIYPYKYIYPNTCTCTPIHVHVCLHRLLFNSVLNKIISASLHNQDTRRNTRVINL